MRDESVYRSKKSCKNQSFSTILTENPALKPNRETRQSKFWIFQQTDNVFGFLTTEPNAEVGAIHPKAMPVILRTGAEIDLWMTAPAAEALQLQRPLPDDTLVIVAKGERSDAGGSLC